MNLTSMLASLLIVLISAPALRPAPEIPSPVGSTTAVEGALTVIKVYGESLENTVTNESPNRAVAVYTPPSYSKNLKRRYPVVYLLHGIGGTHRDWVGTNQTTSAKPWSTLQEVMNRGIAAGLIAEMIVVAPDQRTRGGGSFYTNSKTTGNWEDFTAINLVGHIDSNYRTLSTPSSRGIAGHSMGGYGAIKLGMLHPEIFQVVYGMNSGLLGWGPDLTDENEAYRRAAKATPETLNPNSDFWTASILCIGQALSPNPERPPFYLDLPFEPRDGILEKIDSTFEQWTKQMPLYRVEDYRKNLLSLRAFRFDSGRYDQYPHIISTNRQFSQRLHELGIPHTFEEYNGDHRNKLWGKEGRMATEVFPFFSRQLDFEPVH